MITPGPWDISPDRHALGIYHLNERFQGKTWNEMLDEDAANLTLIAAAPDLLVACQAVLRILQSHQVYDKDARGILERAIELATGVTSM